MVGAPIVVSISVASTVSDPNGPDFYGADPRQRLDVYRPRNAKSPGPVLAYFHGGGYFSGGNLWEARTLPYHLTARGWTCISATYRLRPQFGFTEHLADARAVLTGLMKMQMFTVVTRLRWSWLAARPRKPDGTLSTHSGQTRAPAGDAAVSLYAYYGRYYGRGEDARALHDHLVQGSNQEVWYAELPGGQHSLMRSRHGGSWL